MDAWLNSSPKGQQKVADSGENIDSKKRKASPENKETKTVKTAKKVTKSSVASAPAASPSSSSSSSAAAVPSDVIKLRKELKTKIVSALKKGPYKGNNLPVIEVVHGIPDKALAATLLKTYLPNAEINSATKAMTKYAQMTHEDMETLFNVPETIESTFKGKVWCFADGPTPAVKVDCWFERVEIHVKANEIKLKGRGICNRNQQR